jgi:hypothetical protein
MMQDMRTTVTIDPDVEAMLQRLMEQKRLSFKEALNSALRLGLAGTIGKKEKRKTLPAFDLGLRNDLNLDQALRLSGALEDEETMLKLHQGK